MGDSINLRPTIAKAKLRLMGGQRAISSQAKGGSQILWRVLRYGPFAGGDHMVSAKEELEAAKAAKAAISTILTAARKSEVLATLNKAYRVAVLNLSSGGLLNEARGIVGIALSNVIHGLPTEEKINKAKSAVDTWIANLERSL